MTRPWHFAFATRPLVLLKLKLDSPASQPHMEVNQELTSTARSSFLSFLLERGEGTCSGELDDSSRRELSETACGETFGRQT